MEARSERLTSSQYGSDLALCRKTVQHVTESGEENLLRALGIVYSTLVLWKDLVAPKSLYIEPVREHAMCILVHSFVERDDNGH